MVTSRDVARAAGVSQATVSRVLTSEPRISEATRQRVLAAMREIGYVPNAAAQAMRTRRTGTVGVVVGDLANPFYPQLLDRIAASLAAERLRMTVWLISSAEDTAALQAIREGSIDGLLFATALADSLELRGALDRGGPVVLLNRTLPEIDCDQVGSDNIRGGRLVADRLALAGRANAAFIGGTRAATTSAGRLAGFAAGLAEAGSPLAADRISYGEFRHADGYSAALRLVDLPSPPTAIFCSNDVLAFGALDALRARGIRVPEDVWVIGYDDIEMAAWEGYALSTVRQDATTMADEGVRLLVARLAEPTKAAERVVLEPILVERRSTAIVDAPR